MAVEDSDKRCQNSDGLIPVNGNNDELDVKGNDQGSSHNDEQSQVTVTGGGENQLINRVSTY